MIHFFKQRWLEEGGFGEVLKIAFPLILSTGSWSLQHFIDRTFLTWYSPEAIAASMPAGMANWTIASLFVGIAGYVNTFVAQYFGAKRPERIGPAIWQGIYLAVIALIVAIPVYFFSGWIFSQFGHDSAVLELEIIYFQILMLGIPFVVISSATSSFFSGLGRTWTVMWVNFIGTGINIVLDYCMIFGYFGFPEMGIAGAGWASVIAIITSTFIFFILISEKQYNTEYQTLSGWRFDPDLFRRLLRFGFPNGIQFMLEMLSFTIFILLIGNIGLTELAASNIAFNINMLAFLPMYGLTIGVSILVGQRLGENNEIMAEKTTWSAFYMGFTFFAALGLMYYLIPELFLAPFAAKSNPAEFAPISELTITLLKFVAFYCLFDAGVMIFSGALKGAGDTRFVAISSVSLSWLLTLIPSLMIVYVFSGNIYMLWTAITTNIVVVGFVFYRRFKQGKWKKMRVIEAEEPKSDIVNETNVELDIKSGAAQ